MPTTPANNAVLRPPASPSGRARPPGLRRARQGRALGRRPAGPPTASAGRRGMSRRSRCTDRASRTPRRHLELLLPPGGIASAHTRCSSTSSMIGHNRSAPSSQTLHCRPTATRHHDEDPRAQTHGSRSNRRASNSICPSRGVRFHALCPDRHLAPDAVGRPARQQAGHRGGAATRPAEATAPGHPRGARGHRRGAVHRDPRSARRGLC
jgi:hypothetical protein